MELRLWDHAPQDHHRASTGDVDAIHTGAGTCPLSHVVTTTYSSIMRRVARPTCSPAITRYRPAAPIQRFNNKTLNWPSWIRHFKAVADVHGWDRDQRALQLVSYLDETAMNVAQELADDELSDYDTLVKLLSARFEPASQVSASRSRFHGRMRCHHADADAYADTLTKLCRVGYPQSPPELRQELISEQFVRGQPDPELKKYLWVVIRTQKDRKLQTLIEVCTDFASIGQPTTVHRPVEQVFAMEEEEDPEDVIAMVEQPQWTGRGTTEPQMSPSLQQMFAGWAMKCVQSLAAPKTTARRRIPKERRARTTERRLDRDVIIPGSSASAADRWDTRKPGAPNRISHFPSDRTGGIHSQIAHDSTLTHHNREMTYRPETHPYRSARDSFGPQIISIVHIN